MRGTSLFRSSASCQRGSPGTSSQDLSPVAKENRTEELLLWRTLLRTIDSDWSAEEEEDGATVHGRNYSKFQFIILFNFYSIFNLFPWASAGILQRERSFKLLARILMIIFNIIVRNKTLLHRFVVLSRAYR